MKALDVGVIGCGYAGAAVATLLARSGHRVTIYEEVVSPCAVGAGIVLQPSGMAVLAALGLLDAALARGARLERLLCKTPKGKSIVQLDYARLAPGLFGLGMHRGALFELLYGALEGAGVRVRSGTAILSFESAPRPRVFDAAGQIAGEHELVIVANGARSTIRTGSRLLRRARPYPWGALWFVARDPARVFVDSLRQVAHGTRRFLGLLPTGKGPRDAGDDPHVTLFWSTRMDRVEALRAAGLDAWKAEVLGFEGDAAPVLEQIQSLDQLLVAGYMDVVMWPYHDGRVVYIGDAAHAMSPQLGQGCNLALIDAFVLASLLEVERSIEDSLAEYSRKRRRQIGFYQFVSRWLTPFFQSDLGLLGPLRDGVFALSCRLPWLGAEMLRTMAGLKQGAFSHSPPARLGPS